MTLVYLSLTASDIKPREGELAARLRVPREAIPPETKLLVESNNLVNKGKLGILEFFPDVFLNGLRIFS